jgi:hypothetical protein
MFVYALTRCVSHVLAYDNSILLIPQFCICIRIVSNLKNESPILRNISGLGVHKKWIGEVDIYK